MTGITLPNTLTTDYTIKTVIDASSNTSISGTLPSTRAVGEGMLAFICSTRNALSDITSWPTGWQLEAKRATGATTNPFVWVFSKIVDGTENGGVNATTFTWSGGTPGDTGDDVLLMRMVRGDVDTSDMVGAISAIATGQSVTPASAAITTTKANSIVMYLAAAVNGNRITAVDSNYPSGSTGLLARATRAFSVGEVYAQAYVAVPTIGTSKGSEPWTNLLNNATTFWSALSIELKSASVTITDLNGGQPLKAGSTGNTITFSGAFALSSLAIASLNATNITLTTGTTYSFAIPATVDETARPKYGTQTITASNGTTSILTSAIYSPRAGYSWIDLNNIDYSVRGVVVGFSPAATGTDQIAFPAFPLTDIPEETTGRTSITGTQQLEHWSSVDSKIRFFDLITGGGSQDGSIRAEPITALPIIASAIVAEA